MNVSTYNQLLKAKHPVRLATTFDGAVNGRFIRDAGPLSDVTVKGTSKYSEQFFAVPDTQEVQNTMIQHRQEGTLTLEVIREILATAAEAPDSKVLIVSDEDEGFCPLSYGRLPKGEYYGWCNQG